MALCNWVSKKNLSYDDELITIAIYNRSRIPVNKI